LGQPRKRFRLAARPPRLDLDRAPFDIAEVTQACMQGIENNRSGIGKSRVKKSDERHPLGLLRLRQRGSRQRPGSQEGGEFASM